MAGDWIKFETCTHDKSEVWAIAATLGIDADAVVGKLLRVWAWFDEHTSEGNADTVTSSVTKTLLDRLVGVNGFCNAMVQVGWMLDDATSLSLPKFDRHNGKTAKTRCLTARRVADHKRKGNAVVTPNALPREDRDRDSNTLSLYDEPSLVSKLPDWAAPDWVRWMDLVFQKTGKRMPAVQQEAVAMEILRRGPDRGLADLQFTIKVGAKTLQDASNDYTKPKAPAAAGVGPRGKKEVSF
jgi:hypothetical protein